MDEELNLAKIAERFTAVPRISGWEISCYFRDGNARFSCCLRRHHCRASASFSKPTLQEAIDECLRKTSPVAVEEHAEGAVRRAECQARQNEASPCGSGRTFKECCFHRPSKETRHENAI